MNDKQIWGIILFVIAVGLLLSGVGTILGAPMLAYAVKNLAVKSFNDGSKKK